MIQFSRDSIYASEILLMCKLLVLIAAPSRTYLRPLFFTFAFFLFAFLFRCPPCQHRCIPFDSTHTKMCHGRYGYDTYLVNFWRPRTLCVVCWADRNSCSVWLVDNDNDNVMMITIRSTWLGRGVFLRLAGNKAEVQYLDLSLN